MYKMRKTIAILGVSFLIAAMPVSVRALPTQTTIAQANTEQMFQQGLDKFDAGDYSAAVEILTKIIEKNPEDGEAFFNRGLAFAQLKDYEKAIADYSKVVAINPKDYEAYYSRGLAYAELADDEGAIDDFSQVIQLKPDKAEAYYNRGLARAELEQDAEAIADLQTAAEMFAKLGKKAESEQALALIKQLQLPQK